MKKDRPKSTAVPCTREEFEALDFVGFLKGFERLYRSIPARSCWNVSRTRRQKLAKAVHKRSGGCSMSGDTADYFLDHYGICRFRPDGLGCQCLLKGEWLGRGCRFWKPLGVRSHEELAALFKAHQVRETSR